MTISTTGQIVDTIAADGDYWVGDTLAGSLTVNGGSILSVQSPSAATTFLDARLWLGRNAGVTGTVDISGAGSLIDVVSAGNTTAANFGAQVNVGRVGNGTMTISAGGTLRVRDPIGTTFDPADSSGSEIITVGRGVGSTGILTVNAGNVEVIGTASNLLVGRDSGNGTATFSNGSTLILSSTIAAGDSSIMVGRGGTGILTFDSSTVTVTGGGAAPTASASFGAYINAGRDAGGNGTIRLQNNATMTLNGDSALPASPGADTGANIGRNGGAGLLEVLSGSDLLFTNSPQGANFNVGRVAGTGAVTSGTVNINGAGSTVILDTALGSFIHIGRSVGSTGIINVTNGGQLTADGDTGAALNLGQRDFGVSTGNGGNGTLNISSGGTVVIGSSAGSVNASINSGQYGGTGNINIDAGTLRLLSGGNSIVNLGYIYSASESGAVVTGSGGNASIILTNNALLELTDSSSNFGSFNLGRGAGAVTVEVRSGSRIDLDDDAVGSTYIGVGSGQSAVASTLLVTGTNSQVVGAGSVVIGQNTFETNNIGGNGHVIVENGGFVVADVGVTVGTGGRLSGHMGAIVTTGSAFVAIRDGGILGDAGGAFQATDINGSLSITRGGTVRFDVASAAQDGYDVTGSSTQLAPSGASLFFGRTNIDMNVQGGYQFVAGEERGLFFTSGATAYNLPVNSFGSAWDSTFTVNGQQVDFSYYFGTLANSTNWGMRALNSGAAVSDATLDYGAASTLAATYEYSFDDDKARVLGGSFGVSGGFANYAEVILGTLVGDNLDGGTSDFELTLDGRGGDDTLTGGNLGDMLIGGAGADTLDGGSGWDTTSYSTATAGVQVVMYNTLYNLGDALGDTFTGIEALQGSNHIDVLVGGFGTEAILGGGGGDWIDGTYGADYLYGEGGNDDIASRAFADVIDGGADFDYARYDFADAGLKAYLYDNSQNTGFAAGDTLVSIEGLTGSYFGDDLRGDAGVNVIQGLGGDDFIIGLGGGDLLVGGDGQDLFHYVSAADGGDGIQDFVSGVDRISVTGELFGLGSPGGVVIESWRFVAGTSAIYATSQFIYDSATQQVWYDQDGTGAGAKQLLTVLQAGATLAYTDILVL